MPRLTPQEQDFIDKLYDKQYKMLFNKARSILRDTSISQEVVQDTFYLACKKIDSIMASENPEGWLVRALQYTIIRVMRNKKQAAQYIAQVPENFDFNNIVDERAPNENVETLYSDLTLHKDFELLKEFAVEDKSVKDIAEKHNMSVDTCSKRLSRVKQVFRKLINKQNK